MLASMFQRCVMPAHSRSKNGVASLAYGAGIHVLMHHHKGVDGRDKPGRGLTQDVSRRSNFRNHPFQEGGVS